jgi:hypothetical protein
MRKSNTDAVPRGGRPRGPGAIRQPGNSFAGLWFSYDPETGRHVQHSKAGFASHDEAQGHLTTVLASVRAGTFTRDSGAKVARLVSDHWLPIKCMEGREDNTIAFHE